MSAWDARACTRTVVSQAADGLDRGTPRSDRRPLCVGQTDGSQLAARCACGGLLPGRGDFDAISIRQLQSRMLLRRFTLSHNRSLDGVVGQLSNRDLTEAGPAEMLDLDDDDDERSADHAAARLPGVQRKGAQPCARPFRHGWAGDWNLTSPGAVLRAMAESEGLWV